MQLIAIGLVVIAGLVVWAGGGPPSSTPILVIVGAFGLLGIVLALLASDRRLHDRDKSGHWLRLFYVAPRVINRFGGLLADQGESRGELALAVVCYLIGVGLSIWAFVELGCLRGTKGPNRYGPDPLRSKST